MKYIQRLETCEALLRTESNGGDVNALTGDPVTAERTSPGWYVIARSDGTWTREPASVFERKWQMCDDCVAEPVAEAVAPPQADPATETEAAPKLLRKRRGKKVTS